MREKPKGIDVTGTALPLTSNPFSQLVTPQGNPDEAPAPAQKPKEPREDKPQVKFRIDRTRKGDYPIFVEKRAAGKTVTIIRNLSGDTEELFKLLKKYCAAGGKAFPDSVEIQGDHRLKVDVFLREKGV